MDNPPFGYIDADGKPTGFDVELGQMIGKALGVKVQLEQIIGANRIPFLLTNKIDLVISAMGATPGARGAGDVHLALCGALSWRLRAKSARGVAARIGLARCGSRRPRAPPRT